MPISSVPASGPGGPAVTKSATQLRSRRRRCGRRTPRSRRARRSPRARPRPARDRAAAPERAAARRGARTRSGPRFPPRSPPPVGRRRRMLVIDEDAGRSVSPQLYGLGAVMAGVPEAHRDEQALEARRRLRRDARPRRTRSPRKSDAGGSPTAPAASSSSSSERIASTAMRSGSAWRKTSLNTSSDSGPS